MTAQSLLIGWTAYWLDGLDIPSVHLMEPMFYEERELRNDCFCRSHLTFQIFARFDCS